MELKDSEVTHIILPLLQEYSNGIGGSPTYFTAIVKG